MRRPVITRFRRGRMRDLFFYDRFGNFFFIYLMQHFIKTISPELQAIIKQMIAPDPQARPTVDALLNRKKFSSMLERRNRWLLVKKVKQTIRRTRRVAWSKLCNFKNIVFGFLTSMLTIFMFRDSIVDESIGSTQRPEGSLLCGVGVGVGASKRSIMCTRIIASTTTTADANGRNDSLDFMLGNNCLELSQHSTPTKFAAGNKILNSTPVNYSNHSFRSRKNLTKTSFRTIENGDIENVASLQPPSTVISKASNFLSLDDIELHAHSFTRKPLDTSSLRGKKPFTRGDDWD